MPVSESEKHGVSVLGCRFSEKAEHVPIKKRRFLLRTLSPSQPPQQSAISSQPIEEIAGQLKNQNVSNKLAAKETASSCMNLGHITDDNISNPATKSAKTIEDFGGDEDFSGISILAAAACSSSLGRDNGDAEDGSCLEECSTQNQAHDICVSIEEHSSSRGILKEDLVNSSEMSTGGTSSCVSMKPVGELPSFSTSENSCQKVESVGERMKDAALAAGYLTLSSGVVCSKDEEIVGNEKPSSRDDRLHWDLNVVMDAWEHPFEDPHIHSDLPLNNSRNGEIHNHDDKRESSEGHDSQDTLAATCTEQNYPLAREPRMLIRHTLEGNTNDHNVDAHCDISQPVNSDVKSLLSNCNNDLGFVKFMVEDTNMRQQESVNYTDRLVHSTSDHVPQPSSSGTMNEDEDALGKSLKLSSEGHNNCSSAMEGLSSHAAASSYELENLRSECASGTPHGNASTDIQATPCVSSVNDIRRQVTPTVLNNLETSQGLHDCGNAVVDKVDLDTRDSTGNAHVMSNGSDVLHASCGEALNSASTKSVGAYIASEPLEDNDSQYEDGELRETNECAWNESYVGKEDEHVDYVQDDMQICGTSPTHYHVSESEKVEEKRNVCMGVAPVVSSDVCSIENEGFTRSTKNVDYDGTGGDEDNITKLRHSVEEKMKAPTNDLLDSRKSLSDITTRVKDDDERNDAMTSHGDGLLTETRTELKAFRRGLRSQIEGPVTRDVSSRQERLTKMESRYGESSSVRSYERVRFPFYNQGRGRQGDTWDGSFDGRRGIKRHYSPILHGSKLDDDGIMERDDMRSVDTLGGVSYSHHVLSKSRSGPDEDAYTDVHSRCKPDRKFSPDRTVIFGRGRSFRYGPAVDSRLGRVRYNNGPSPDDSFQSSLKYRRPLSRRERSLSPFGGRGLSNAHHSRGNSPSQSRSRSPTMWQSQRGRLGPGSGGNTFYRHRNRSPSFRSEVRVQRLRSPHHQPGSVTDHAMGMRSFARNHASPPRGRWTSCRKEELCHFREFGYKQRTSALERSPGRTHMRGNKADVVDSPRNVKLDGHYRISDRISVDAAGRGFSYEENYEDRRKQYGSLRSLRHNYEDGMPNRLNLDINDGFPANNIRDRDASNFQGRGLRSIGCRVGDLPRRLRGEQRSFIYERDGKFNPSSKKFGVDVMDSSSNMQSEEQYQSTHVGRFSDIDRSNRGRRYENYEDRTKQYGAVVRHTDMGPTGKRLNYNGDENFQDAPDFHGRGTRNLDGPIGSVSTRLEDHNTVVCEQEAKLSDNPQAIGTQNANDNDVKK